MYLEIENLKRNLSAITANISDDKINYRLLIIEGLLTDYDFFEDSDEITLISPLRLLNSYLDTFYPVDGNERLFSEWFAILSLYFLNKISEKKEYAATCFRFSDNAYKEATEIGNRKARLEREIERRDRDKGKEANIALNLKKYAPNRAIKKRAFEEIPDAIKLIETNGSRATAEAITEILLPLIQSINFHPKTGEKIIGRDNPDGSPGDEFGTLLKWVREYRRQEKAKAPSEE